MVDLLHWVRYSNHLLLDIEFRGLDHRKKSISLTHQRSLSEAAASEKKFQSNEEINELHISVHKNLCINIKDDESKIETTKISESSISNTGKTKNKDGDINEV